jgi:hypothetical protein
LSSITIGTGPTGNRTHDIRGDGWLIFPLRHSIIIVCHLKMLLNKIVESHRRCDGIGPIVWMRRE